MYERLIKSMRGFHEQRMEDRVALMNGQLPWRQQKKMDSIIKQAMRIGTKRAEEIARAECGESIWDSVVRFARERTANGQDVTSDLGKVWAAARIAELEKHIELLDKEHEAAIEKLKASHNGLVRCIYNFWDKRRDNAGFISHFEDNKIMQRPEEDKSNG